MTWIVSSLKNKITILYLTSKQLMRKRNKEVNNGTVIIKIVRLIIETNTLTGTFTDCINILMV
jgi:hypothetical protein